MLIAHYQTGDKAYYGILEGSSLRRLSGSLFEQPTPTGEIDALDRVRLLSPVDPPRIFGAGLNYISHIEEMKLKRPVKPLLFMKPPTSVVGPNEPIIYPRSDEDIEVHYEGELVAIIGKRARRLSKSEALGAVFGYTCGNDLSERVIQRIEMGMGHLLIGKAYDTFCHRGDLDAVYANRRLSSFGRDLERPLADAHHFRDARPAQIHVQDANFVTPRGKTVGEIDRHRALADAALPTHHRNLVLDPAHPCLNGRDLLHHLLNNGVDHLILFLLLFKIFDHFGDGPTF